MTIVSTLKLLHYLTGSHCAIHMTVAHICITQDKDPIKLSLLALKWSHHHIHSFNQGNVYKSVDFNIQAAVLLSLKYLLPMWLLQPNSHVITLPYWVQPSPHTHSEIWHKTKTYQGSRYWVSNDHIPIFIHVIKPMHTRQLSSVTSLQFFLSVKYLLLIFYRLLR